MADRYMFCGGGMASVRTVAGTPSETTAGGTFSATYSDVGINTGGTAAVGFDFVTAAGASDAAVSGETLYAHAACNFTSTASARFIMEIEDAANLPWLGLRTTTTSGIYGFYYNSGTGASPVWTLIGSTFTISSALHDCDIVVTLGSPHIAKFYLNGVEMAGGSFTAAGFTSADAVYLQGPSSGSNYWSELLATVGHNTIGAHVAMIKPTGAGASSGFSGTSVDIDDTILNDADMITSATAAQRSTFAYGDLPTTTTSQFVGDVFLYTRAKNDGAAPTGFKPVRRDSTPADNLGATVVATAGFVTYLTRYAGLSKTEINASQFGVESAT